ncbi:polyketide cyclase [Streptomyces sp. Tue6028]|uniref:SRPBCC family protein n=1 Tax=Streptomyces sp. Tue6028 TaxID=2036037 RepID=UPI000BB37A30|nr:SRPBCC family protein [Streptomyces sp. Tue6028]PBC63000.1 polyketide cyclase [Streptomyces sp. Tue6028]
MFDVTQQIDAVRRQVGAREYQGRAARVVTVGQTYGATVEDVWDACTNAERIPRWFLPVTGELRLGGRYQLEGNAGGVVERCEPPLSFAATWEFGDEVSWIEVLLAEEPEGGTRFVLQHIAHVDDERWAEYGPGAVGVGWDLGIMGLARHLGAPGGALDPKEGTAWLASEEGRRFVRESSESWYEANVAAGEDEAAARAAADRTTAAYGGTAPE